MKMKMAFVGLLVALFVLNVVPVQATDLPGYVKADPLVDWDWGALKHDLWVRAESGKMLKNVEHWYIENTAEFPLTEAVYLISITEVHLCDASGTIVLSITDPAEIAQVVRIENSDELWHGNYVFWLGTIQPGHSKQLHWNWWFGELLASWEYSWGMSFEYLTWQGVWYLP